MHVTAIIAAGGAGKRLGASVPKQLLEIGGRPILQQTVDAFVSHPRISEVIVALPAALASAPPPWLSGVKVIAGGETRQASVANAFDVVAGDSQIVLVHDAARPFVGAEVISRAIDGAHVHGAAIVAVPVHDTVKRVDRSNAAPVIVETLSRDTIYMAQTPQAFKRDVLAKAVAVGRSGIEATDEAALAERAGYSVHVVPGDAANVKITTAADLDAARAAAASSAGPVTTRIGIGYDLHKLGEGRPLVLGGVEIPSDRGALGHSDADVVCHAVTDAILGAARAGDIGQHYPDTDARWKDAVSTDLLRDTVAIVRKLGWMIENVDVVIVLERPKLGTHKREMEQRLAAALGVGTDAVSVKAKTNEGVDAVGRGEAVAAHAVAQLRRGLPAANREGGVQ
jgi:2-C-methyl-D-erythritol 4-phosphate cytidylyltransferase/2-C-methyl-D-erythritol 2,4-cyclodiphosphate synthase